MPSLATPTASEGLRGHHPPAAHPRPVRRSHDPPQHRELEALAQSTQQQTGEPVHEPQG
ncbi:hypothetical protein [Streptomyces sp. NPDC059649]|uniref:hypothetical protein n=1 Tax=Streptomyces sp. NPDC059649 TaxID=3346895 RepID=UPI0036A1EEE3